MVFHALIIPAAPKPCGDHCYGHLWYEGRLAKAITFKTWEKVSMKAQAVKRTLKMSSLLFLLTLVLVQVTKQLWSHVLDVFPSALVACLIVVMGGCGFVAMICLQILLASSLMIDDAMTRPMKDKVQIFNWLLLRLLTDDAKRKHHIGLEEIAAYKRDRWNS
jgi:hypothetical protein